MGELGEFAKHAAEFKALDVQLLAISVDPADRAREVQSRFKDAVPILSDAKQQVMDLYGTRSPEYKNQLGIDINTPTLVLIDRQGIIRWIHQASNYRIRASVEDDLAEARKLPPATAKPPENVPAAASVTGQYMDRGGGKLYYEECGSGHAINVVLLHDGLLHSVSWDGVWQPLCAQYHVLRYDRRGYGRSAAAIAPYVPEDDLLLMLEHAGMQRAILVGNSSGAGLALDFALAHRERTEGLFLIGPVVHGMPSSAYFLERGNRNSEPAARGDMEAAARNWSQDRYLVAHDDPPARQALFQALAQNPQNLKTGGQFEIRPSPPTVLRLNQIQAPTLLLVGDADIADVIAYAGALEAELPIALFEVWQDSGHMIQLEHPSQVVERFQRFARLADRSEVAVATAVLQKYAGSYRFFNRSIRISLRDRHLALELPDLPAKPLFAATNDRFFVRTTETEFEFHADARGKISELVIYNADGNTLRCPRDAG